MRTKLIAGAAIMAAGAAGIAALPSSTGAVSSGSVRLLGVISGPNLISVTSDGSGTGATGNVFIIVENDNTRQIRGNVVCESFSGNQAFVVYQDVSDSAGGYVRIVDNGPAGTTPVDEQNNGRLTATQLANQVSSGCPVPTSGAAFHPTHTLQSGEAIVSTAGGST